MIGKNYITTLSVSQPLIIFQTAFQLALRQARRQAKYSIFMLLFERIEPYAYRVQCCAPTIKKPVPACARTGSLISYISKT
jgi:hypothetical protein